MRLHTCCVVLISTYTLFLSAPHAIVAQDIADLSRYVKAPSDSVRHFFGAPDRIAYSEIKDAEIWTYYHKLLPQEQGVDQQFNHPLDSAVVNVIPVSDMIDPIRARAGVTQFAFWNDHVASVSRLRTDHEAQAFYDASVVHLTERASWVGRAGTDSAMRITRIGDDVWTVYRSLSDTYAQTVVTIGDAGFLACSRSDTSAERERVKRQFGILLQQGQ